MSQKAVTIIVSDLHVGGGKADPGDDFVSARNQFPALMAELSESPEGREGAIEFIINGDFLEFAQVRPELYTLHSSEYWCSQTESCRKLDAVLSGHPELFQALKAFQEAGNQVTIAAGNHDVDLYWHDVQEEIRKAAGQGVAFELGSDWYARHGGRLRISHGHMIDPANRFSNWKNPLRLADHGVMRLEMCPGTLFVVKFVNWLEKRYPFADNIHPVTALAGILAREDRLGLGVVGWMLSKFLVRHPGAALGLDKNAPAIQRILQYLRLKDEFALVVAGWWSRIHGAPVTLAELRGHLKTEKKLNDFMLEVVARIPPDEWVEAFDGIESAVLSVGDDLGAVLAVQQAGSLTKEAWRADARRQWANGGQVAVIGHTHQPDQVHEDGRAYYNPGSWTRYVEESKAGRLSLKDLVREEDFPYQLNYVRVAEGLGGKLESRMICFDQG